MEDTLYSAVPNKIVNDKEFDKEKEKYCPKCYFLDSITIEKGKCKHSLKSCVCGDIETKFVVHRKDKPCYCVNDIEEVLRNRVKMIGDNDCTFIGSPDDIIKELECILDSELELQKATLMDWVATNKMGKDDDIVSALSLIDEIQAL